MQVTFLGTGAAEGYPSPFCRCENCQRARRLKGKNLRLRSSLLVNDDLLVDYNDVIASCAFYGCDLTQVETLLITHPHEDHLYTEQLFIRARPFAATPVPQMQVFGPRDAVAQIEAWQATNEHDAHLSVQAVAGGDRWQCGDYRFEAVGATHGTEDPLLYVIEQGQRCILYSTDTGAYSDETWARIQGHRYDLVIIDATLGQEPSDLQGHLNAQAVIDYRQRYEKAGLLKDGARFVAHHFSHNGNPAHKDLVALYSPHGVAVAYDGLSLTI